MEFKNKKLKDVIKKQSLPYNFEYIGALKSSSGKKKDLMGNPTVLCVGKGFAFCSENGQERVYSLGAEFRIKKS